MPTFRAYRFRELNATQSPCGMNDLVASGKYANLRNFLRHTGVDKHYRALAIRGFRELVIFASADPRSDVESVVARVNLQNYIDYRTEVVGRRECGVPYRWTVETQAQAGNWVKVESTNDEDMALRTRAFQYELGNVARLVDETK